MLEQGVVTTVDSVSLLMAMVNQGMSIPLAGTIILRDSFGEAQREWSVVGAHLQKYVGPQLNRDVYKRQPPSGGSGRGAAPPRRLKRTLVCGFGDRYQQATFYHRKEGRFTSGPQPIREA